ncbi:MAG: hypothetical protein JWR26_424 [Pedosphaera sp.]|nr:hypothetical protein [Pedosphaera sp.]
MRLAKRIIVAFGIIFMGCTFSGCEHGRLLRPNATMQSDPDVVWLRSELPDDVDGPNKETIARLCANGGQQHAKRGEGGVYKAEIRIPEGQLIWKPSIIVMETGGELDLEFINEDPDAHHGALLPSNGSPVIVTFGQGERGRARIRLDGPGQYWFSSPVANYAGRGMVGLIVVGGEVPDYAKLDRPKQKRP